jgi:hypothetical protein
MSNTHEVNIIRIGEVLPHPNADKLEITMVGGYQVVIGKGNFVEADLAIYIQPDSVVPQTEPFKFIWENHVGIDGKVPAKRRRITVKRLRKEYSEGLLMPLDDFKEQLQHIDWCEGSDVAALLGIEHYVPEFDAENTAAMTAAMPKRKYPKTLRGWFFFALFKLGLKGASKSYAQEVSFDLPVYDVNALKNARRTTFRDGESIQITEKIHGSNGRYVFIDDKFYIGSHEQWKLDGPHVWGNVVRNMPEIEEFVTQHPGMVLYGEVGPTQKGYRYGAGNGETFFYAFDVYDPETGEWYWPGNLGFASTVPVVYTGAYSPEIVKQNVDGKSLVPGAENIREGIVVSSRERRLKLKVVSNAYLEGDSK